MTVPSWQPAPYALCMVHYGTADRTLRALHCSFALEHPPALRLVVDNDPSSKLASKLNTLPGPVTYLSAGKNIGYGAAANLALHAAHQHCGAELMWLLNNDVLFKANAATPLLEAMHQNPQLAIVGPRLLDISGDKIWHDGGLIHWPGAKVISRHHDQPLLSRPASKKLNDEIDFVCGCAPMIRYPAFHEVNGFEENWFLYYEDVDISFKLVKAGWELAHQDQSVVRHEGSATTGIDQAGQYYQIRNRLLFIARHSPHAGAMRLAGKQQLRKAWWEKVRGRIEIARTRKLAVLDAMKILSN